jgi:hypothetical protein
MLMLLLHLFLAFVLFLLVNWIGKHAVEFGYSSTTLFDDANENLALNFFIRACAPAVFIVVLSMAFVAAGYQQLRLGIVWVPVYYYLVRAFAILLLNRQRLTSWLRYLVHAIAGTAVSVAVYDLLILPNRSLFPNLETAGNELWLVIVAFFYAVSNQVSLSSSPGEKRRLGFVEDSYRKLRSRFGNFVDNQTEDDLLKLIVYSIMVYENYARPPALRQIERLMFWKKNRSTGVMQVKSPTVLSDLESVKRGTEILLNAWTRPSSADMSYNSKVRDTIVSYNPDDAYFWNVYEVMRYIATDSDKQFERAYQLASDYELVATNEFQLNGMDEIGDINRFGFRRWQLR